LHIDRRYFQVSEFAVSLLFLVLGAAAALLVRHYVPQNASGTLRFALATALLSAGCVSLMQTLSRWFHYWLTVRPFEIFWGQKYLAKSTGSVHLQSDGIGDVLKTLAPNLDTILDNAPNNRLFKARTWLNHFDAEGAKEIRAEFSKHGFDPPGFTAMDRHETPHASEGFRIYMGLGYTEEIVPAVNRICEPWMSIVRGATQKVTETEVVRIGDAIRLRRNLEPDASSGLHPRSSTEFFFDGSETSTPNGSEGDFSVLLPEEWSIQSTYSMDAAGKKKQRREYGYIFRSKSHEDSWSDCPLLFHVGGFTEEGTWAAGHYLATHWKDLYDEYVRSSKSGGNFVVFVVGVAPFSAAAPWAKVHAITPEDVAHCGIPSAWTKLVPKRPK
jgi:hypothetical protein